MRTTSAVCLVVLAASGAAVAGAAGQTRGLVGEGVRDSAGVRIVHDGVWPQHPVWATVGSKPMFRVGWNPTDHEFEDVVAGDILPDGRAVVADGGRTLQVILLSESGGIQTVIGGPGQGPGEFGDIYAVSHVDSSTIVIDDPRSGRISVFRSGQLLKDFRIGGLANLSVLGADSGGSVLMGPPLRNVMGRRYPTPWLAVPLVTVDPTTERVDTVGATDWDQSILFGGNNPFRSQGFAAATPSGFVVGRGDVAELRWLDSRGQLRQVLRWEALRTKITDADWAAYARAFSAALRQHGVPTTGPYGIDARLKLMRAAVREPVPIFRPIQTDPEGNVWIGSYVLRASPKAALPQRFDVVSPQGMWLGVVYLPPPARFTLLAVGRDRVLGVSKNDLDVEAIVMYGLSR